jgi:SNF2 family DNA or RNA helicase
MFLHQQKAVSKVLPARCNALFMDMGTGKTRTTIELLKIRQNQYDKVFWFTPVSLKYNVYLEFLKHTNLKKEDIYLFNQKTTDKTEIKQKFIIVGIESLASSDRTHLALDSMIKENSFIVVDESSFIKGNSKRTKRIVRLTKHTKYRTILTGTPISQGIVDLYNQMYFLSPKILDYRNFYQFANNHLQYHKKIPGMIIAEYNKEYIAAKIAPYTYQVTKEECLDLKGKKYIEKYFHMSDEQNKMYQSAKEDFFESFESYETDSVFLLFNELQQIISGFKYTKNKKAKIINTIRAEVLKNIIEEIGEKQKIIIWTKYTADIEIIESMLIDNFKDSEYVIFSGSKNESEKAMALNNFKYNDEVRFFIATQSTGAFGLNLPEASYTVFYNNGFKYSERIQAEDRNYRIGQNEAVTYIDIICNNSIDTKIYNTLLSKGNVATSFKKDLEQVKDKKLKKSLLNAIIDGNLDEVNRIIEKAKLAQENTAAKRMEKMRRKKGVIKRKDYLQNSITQKAPWKELGISRTTWYRNLKSEKE